MKKHTAPKQLYDMRNVNAILRVAESVREIRSEYPEHNKMRVFRVMEGAFLYTFKAVRRDRLQFVAREPASEQMLKEVAEAVAELAKKDGAAPTHAISLRQPYVELILRGIKKAEYRSRRTSIRGRVYLYAAKQPVHWPAGWRRVDAEPGDLPTGVIVGTVDITGCRRHGNGYAYILSNPKRLKRNLKPKSRPSPCFWRPVF
jgi:hypothetical protein